MVNQIDKQRSVDQIGNARRMEIEQRMAKCEHHVGHQDPEHGFDHDFQFKPKTAVRQQFLVEHVGYQQQQ
ncbi:hypothetical protein D3C77_683950 [compost metagenome]